MKSLLSVFLSGNYFLKKLNSFHLAERIGVFLMAVAEPMGSVLCEHTSPFTIIKYIISSSTKTEIARKEQSRKREK